MTNTEDEKAAREYIKTLHPGHFDPYPMTLLEMELADYERKAYLAALKAERERIWGSIGRDLLISLMNLEKIKRIIFGKENE